MARRKNDRIALYLLALLCVFNIACGLTVIYLSSYIRDFVVGVKELERRLEISGARRVIVLKHPVNAGYGDWTGRRPRG